MKDFTVTIRFTAGDDMGKGYVRGVIQSEFEAMLFDDVKITSLQIAMHKIK